jgi:hypothetical protein
MSVEEGCCCLYSTYIIPSPMCGIIWGVNCCLFWSYVARSALNNDSDEGKRRREDCGHCCDENYFNSCCMCTYYSVQPTPHSCCCSQSLKVHYPFLETNKKTITRTPLKSCWNKMTCYMCGTPYKPSEKYKDLKEIEPDYYHGCYKNCNRCCDENYYSAYCFRSCCWYQRLKEDNVSVRNNVVYNWSTPLKKCWNKMTCYMCGTPYKVSDPQKYKKLIEKYKKLKEKYKYDNEINIHLYDDDDKNDTTNSSSDNDDNKNDNILALTKI